MPSITIFEGPDGGGKTSAAREYAKRIKALYYHFSAWRHMEDQYPRLFLEAMMPALMGYQNVVMDRSWLSDRPYNAAYHKGKPLISSYNATVLERVAMRCDTNVIMCLPPKEVCLENFRSRMDSEMLDDPDQLEYVYLLYREMVEDNKGSALPITVYDYTKNRDIYELVYGLPFQYMKHSVKWRGTVGSATARNIIVGDLYCECDKQDLLNAWPTVGFGPETKGMANFSQVLAANGVHEGDVFWIDRSILQEVMEWRMKNGFPIRKVLAFDNKSAETCRLLLEKLSNPEIPVIHLKQHPNKYQWSGGQIDIDYYNVLLGG